MKKVLGFAMVLLLLVAACQPDSSDEPTPDTSASIDFVGSWNRDTVIVNDVYPNKVKVRLETEYNYGVYTFNSDLKTGVVSFLGSDFAITWRYNSSAKTMLINEIDWENITYTVQQISKNKMVLTGYKNTGDGNQNERIIYLTRK